MRGLPLQIASCQRRGLNKARKHNYSLHCVSSGARASMQTCRKACLRKSTNSELNLCPAALVQGGQFCHFLPSPTGRYLEHGQEAWLTPPLITAIGAEHL